MSDNNNGSGSFTLRRVVERVRASGWVDILTKNGRRMNEWIDVRTDSIIVEARILIPQPVTEIICHS